MSASTEPGADSAKTAGEYSLRKQLDALAAGKIDNAAFLRATLQRFRVDSEESWEVLSLLDQYHRLGKIKADTFHEIKTKIAEFALGSMDSSPATDSVLSTPAPPPPLAAPPPIATAPASRAATPAATPAPKPSADDKAPTLNLARDPSTGHASTKDASGKQTSSSVKSTSPADPPRDAKVGDVLRRRYRLEGILGTGSMGTVYEASDPLRLDVPPLGQRMAIKVLHSAVAKRLELLQELRREFQDLQLLSHPNILRAYEFDRDGPLAFFTMEALSGISLPRLLSARQQGPLPRPFALAMIRDIASAVSHAHSRNLLHGDINPQSVFITTRGEVRLLNFGKVLRVGVSPISIEEEPLMSSSATPGYASCQVLEGDQRTVQDDLFSLACVASLILSGQHPYKDNSAIEARAMRLSPRRPRGLSHGQWSALRSALQFERRKRPVDVATWMSQLDLRDAAIRMPPVGEIIEARAPGFSRALPIAALGAVIAALGLVYWVATPHGAAPPDAKAIPQSAQVQVQPAPAPAPPAPLAVAAKPAAPAPAPSPSPSPAPPAVRIADAQVPKRAESSVSSGPPPTTTVPVAEPAVGGHAKVEMITDTVEAPPGEHAVQIIVRRRGALRGETSFNWWTESGTAKPGTDFVAVVPRLERMEDGQSSATLTVAVTDVLRAQPKSFYVVIDEAEGGATLNGRRLTMITLQ